MHAKTETKKDSSLSGQPKKFKLAKSYSVFNFFYYERGPRTLEKTEGRARQGKRDEQTRRKEGERSRLERRRQGRRE